MALNALVDSLDTVPEALRGEYAPVADGDNKGKFLLSVTGVGGYALDNVENLRTTFQTTKSQLETATSALNGYNGLKMKPSDISTKLKRLGELEALDPEREADKLAETKLNGFKSQITTEFEGKLTDKDKTIGKLNKQVERLLVTTQLQDAITKHGGNSKLLTPVLAGRVRVKEDGEGNLVTHVVDETGNADMTYRDGNIVASTIDDLVNKFKSDKDYGTAFSASGRSGSGTPHVNNGNVQQGAQTVTSKEWLAKVSSAKDADARKLLFQERAAGKITVTD